MGDLAGYDRHIIATGFYSGTAATGTADISLPIFPAPFGGVTITQAWASTQDAVAANASNTLDVILINGGTAGTATTAIGTAAAAGTAGWTAGGIKSITLNSSADELTSGQWLVAKFDVAGTITLPQAVRYTIEYVHGKG